ncbi:hypothetical protein B0W47_08275 [Komagataeibacter nataicola]|uniref:Uncharacterized protein n=1 Tax=Komagataeibacter nataicola TaxID=265960 RepID=A0A9N7H0S1_9PROT|nr:hypothetical protein [Komagataeibacter nataicola]AQU87477.1 hypothetical protein B0W47_08275 [Komagataeibacter nataicola]PYD65967.1 hypothetical protein CDI09_10745 [Komagataeibacter nataicola]WEQ55216.1 hypothetical protein LV564_14065 [Komagataeibacter nataicola]GBR19408.1 hypothetical protein AA0616_1535 [Komagataeibacter nataicola NRIC 0616]
MSYAALDAVRIARACKTALNVLETVEEKDRSEAHQRKTIMIQRIEALARAAAESKNNDQVITLTSEEFWLISQNW